jgi:hypothetical protein
MFEVVFDYGESDFPKAGNEGDEDPFVLVNLTKPEEDGKHWPARQDPFSSYPSGFEVRTYRLCHRVLMLHHSYQSIRCIQNKIAVMESRSFHRASGFASIQWEEC